MQLLIPSQCLPLGCQNAMSLGIIGLAVVVEESFALEGAAAGVEEVQLLADFLDAGCHLAAAVEIAVVLVRALHPAGLGNSTAVLVEVIQASGYFPDTGHHHIFAKVVLLAADGLNTVHQHAVGSGVHLAASGWNPSRLQNTCLTEEIILPFNQLLSGNTLVIHVIVFAAVLGHPTVLHFRLRII